MFKIFKRKRKYQGLSEIRIGKVLLEVIEGGKNRKKNTIFEEYYDWEHKYPGDDFPKFDDFLKYKDWIEDLERGKGLYTEGEESPSGNDKEI